MAVLFVIQNRMFSSRFDSEWVRDAPIHFLIYFFAMTMQQEHTIIEQNETRQGNRNKRKWNDHPIPIIFIVPISDLNSI